MSLRDVTIARAGLQSAGDVTHWKRAEDFGDLKKVSRVENWIPNETVDFRLLAEALGRCRTRFGGGSR